MAFSTAYSVSLTTDTASATQQTFRFVFTAANLSVSGNLVRLTFTPKTSGTGLVINACWIGNQGVSAPNFDGGQVQMFFNGAAGATLTSGGAAVVSDPKSFNFNRAANFVVAVDCDSNNRRFGDGNTGLQGYFKSETGTAGNTTVSGYSTDTAGRGGPLSRIEADFFTAFRPRTRNLIIRR
jgi:hypothetical protein